MLIECYDKSGAEVYEIIIKQIFQDLVLGASRRHGDPLLPGSLSSAIFRADG